MSEMLLCYSSCHQCHRNKFPIMSQAVAQHSILISQLIGTCSGWGVLRAKGPSESVSLFQGSIEHSLLVPQDVDILTTSELLE